MKIKGDSKCRHGMYGRVHFGQTRIQCRNNMLSAQSSVGASTRAQRGTSTSTMARSGISPKARIGVKAEQKTCQVLNHRKSILTNQYRTG